MVWLECPAIRTHKPVNKSESIFMQTCELASDCPKAEGPLCFAVTLMAHKLEGSW